MNLRYLIFAVVGFGPVSLWAGEFVTLLPLEMRGRPRTRTQGIEILSKLPRARRCLPVRAQTNGSSTACGDLDESVVENAGISALQAMFPLNGLRAAK